MEQYCSKDDSVWNRRTGSSTAACSVTVTSSETSTRNTTITGGSLRLRRLRSWSRRFSFSGSPLIVSQPSPPSQRMTTPASKVVDWIPRPRNVSSCFARRTSEVR
uniref:(northern house mosquito) hypothetical protein n=1 Tax=Culex pipiens TaxID=7175 RepID=A0A8D8I7Z8_CULPI